MAALTFALLFSFSWIFVLARKGTLELKVKVKPGEDATLLCRGHRGADITVLRWTRADLKPDDGYVFFFRDDRLSENHQHPSFRGRVELRDPEMKDGDASVILKNVNINDAGTYECWVREEHGSELFSIIRLTVTERQELKVKPGEDTILQCHVPSQYMKSDLMWMRTKPWLDTPVVYFQVNVSFEEYLHESYRGRVELADPELKDGNFSVILKNVTINDAGTYECDWFRWLCMSSPHYYLSVITLSVTGHTAGNTSAGGDKDEVIKDRGKMNEAIKDRGNKDVRKAEGNRSFLHSREHVGLLVDLLLGTLLVAVVVVAVVVFRFIICRKYKVLTEINSY